MKITPLLAAGLLALCAAPAAAQIKVGELNSYKAFPAFLDPYKKGWQLALDEINASGGVNGQKIEVVSREDGATPGDAVRVAEELLAREKVQLIMGTFASHIGLAVSNLAAQRKVLFIAAEPLTDKIVWENGNRYTFRIRPSTYMQTAMLIPDAVKQKKQRWAIVYPNYEYGQSATRWFKELMTKAQPGVQFVGEQAPALGKIDAGAVAQALADAKPDAIFSSLFGADLQKFVREGNLRGLFKNMVVFNLLAGEPEYLDTLKDETPNGWYVTGYPWDQINTPAHKKFREAYEKKWKDYPRLGSIVGYSTMQTVAHVIRKAKSSDTEKMIDALRGMEMDTPIGPIVWRGLDHQSTMGAYVGKIAKKGDKGVMVDWKFAPGDQYLPSFEQIKSWRKE